MTARNTRTAVDDLDGQVRAEQVRLLYTNSPLAILIGLAVAAALAWVFRASVPPGVLNGWLAALLLVSAARLVLCGLYRRRRPQQGDHRPWLAAFTTGALVAGAIWGTAAPLLLPAAGPAEQAFLIICLAGIAAGAVTSLSWIHAVALSFIVPALAPLLGHLALADTPLSASLAVLVALFLGGTGLMSQRFASHARQSLRLRIETEQQRQQLELQEARYRSLVESTSAIFWEQEPEQFRFTFVSSEAEAVLGYPVADWLVGRDFWLDHMHPGDREWVPASFADAFRARRQSTYEYRMIAADGSIVWLRDTASVIVRDGRPIKNVGVMLDITQTRAIQAELEYVSGLQAILVTVSHALIAGDGGADDAAVDDALARIGEHCAVARSYQFRFHDDGRRMSNTHEWCARGIHPQIDRLQGLPCREMPALTTAMQQREVVTIPSVADLGEEWQAERAILQSLDIAAIVLVPVPMGDRVDGFLGFDAVAAEREWGREEIRLLCVLADLIGASQQRAEVGAALRASEARHRGVLESISEVVYRTDAEGRFTFLNAAWASITGFAVDDSIGRPHAEFVHADDRGERWREHHALIVGDREASHQELRHLTRDGSVRWIGIEARPVHDDGRAVGTTGTLRDVTGQREAERRMRHLAHYDALTDLPNRSLALDRLDQMLKGARRNRDTIAVLFVDLDGFKKVNDTLGHEAGDALLVEAAGRLAGGVRDGDTVARLSGDEFLVLLPGISEPTDAGTVAAKLLACFRAAFRVGSRDLHLTASIGIALAPTGGETPESLLRNADTAMYQSKHAGRNTYHFFTQAMSRDIARHLAVEERLRGALERGEVSLAFQPLVHLVSGEIVGAEALARWHDRELGTVAPDEFVPVAEQTGLIGALGRGVLDGALERAARWRRTHRPDFRVSVNVSPYQFREASLTAEIDAALEHAGLPGDALEIEITEGVLLGHHREVDRTLAGLRERGVGIAMDDFGTGYASLSYVRDYPFDTLKIDRGFVHELNADPAHRSLVDTTLRMARAFGLRAIAEGVETEAELAVLREQGCELAQGFLFSAPVAAAEFESLLPRADVRQPGG